MVNQAGTSNNNMEADIEISKKDKQLVRRKVVLSRIKRKILRHTWTVRLGLIASVLLGIFVLLLLAVSLLRKTRFGYYINLASDFLLMPKEKIEIIDNRTNVLILGKGGDGHEAPDLTDTIIFASLKHPDYSGFLGRGEGSTITLVSLPRDIWIPELRAKLNSTYYWGNQKEPPVQGPSNRPLARREGGGGLKLAKSSVEKIVGKPVQYGVVIDFEAFKEVINVLAGVEVEVENSFIDQKYPIPGREDDECGGDDSEFGCRYETIKFEKGTQHMDGETALKFVRSRNAGGDEGTDIARSARQQKIIAAIKDKVLSREILFSLDKLMELKEVVGKYVETDIDMSAAIILARRMLQAKDDINSHILPEEFLENPPTSPRYDNLYVFVPRAENWSQVHEWTESVLKD